MPEEKTKDAKTEAKPPKDEAKKEIPKDKNLDSKTVQVKIYSPFRTYFNGQATSVSAENETGPFDVLPQHHHFMTLLNSGDITVRTEEGEQKYRIARGIMHVKNNGIIIFLDV